MKQKLTLKLFKELTKHMPDDTVICVPIEAGKEWSILGTVNFVHLTPIEHSYGNKNVITIGQGQNNEGLKVSQLIGKNSWDEVSYEQL